MSGGTEIVEAGLIPEAARYAPAYFPQGTQRWIKPVIIDGRRGGGHGK